MDMESEVDTQETDELPQKAGPQEMISYEGTSAPTTYLPTRSSSSEKQDTSILMYGRNNRTDNRVTAKKFP